MTVSAHSNSRRLPEVATHLFRVGQTVRMKRRFGVSPTAAELFRIMATLPARDNSPQYRIRSDEERHERVATEDSLEPVGESSTPEDATLIGRTFGNGQGTEAQQSRASKADAGEGPAQA